MVTRFIARDKTITTNRFARRKPIAREAFIAIARIAPIRISACGIVCTRIYASRTLINVCTRRRSTFIIRTAEERGITTTAIIRQTLINICTGRRSTLIIRAAKERGITTTTIIR